MARQEIDIGSTANDGTGDPLRTAFNKINENFVEVYSGIGGTTFIGGTVPNPTTFQSTTASTSTSTGAVVVAGGMGVQGNLRAAAFFGNGSGLTGITVSSATTAGTVTTASQPNITSVGTLTSLTVTGNINANIVSAGTSQFSTITVTSLANVTSTTASTSTTTGALRVAGGAGIAGDVHANAFYGSGAGLTDLSVEEFNGGTVTNAVVISNSTVSSSTATGALQVSGGVGVAGNVHANAFYGDGSNLTGIASSFDGILARINVIIRSAEVAVINDNATISGPATPGGAGYTDTFTADEDGQIYYYSAGTTGSIDADWAIDLTGLDLDPGHATSITAIIDQGSTGYLPNTISIDSAEQTVQWQGGSAPAANANKTDVVIYSIICLRAGPPKEYLVLGQLVTFAAAAPLP
jgi:hypothetical protein